MFLRKIFGVILFWLALPLFLFSQDNDNNAIDSLLIRKIYSVSLLNQQSYKHLSFLVDSIGGRICGSENADKAVLWAEKLMQSLTLDTVYLEECFVKNWVRDKNEYAYLVLKGDNQIKLHITSLGGSVGTLNKEIKGNLIEVSSFDELKSLPKDKLKDKIIFFNRPANPEFINTFHAYGDAVDQRVHGAVEAAKYGGVAALVRAVTLSIDTFPHTGIMRYDDKIAKVPAMSLSTSDANMLHDALVKNPDLMVHLKSNNVELPEKKSYNVIGEIRGKEFPDEFITVGGHLDSWDTDPGAHDDGAGCMHAIDVAMLFNKINYQPKHTIRIVFFMDEEYAQRGGRKYAENAANKKEKNLAAIESDEGGLSPHGFSINADSITTARFINFKKYFEPYGLNEFIKGYGGVDIQFLRNLNVPQIGLMVDSQRYFDYHHAATDTMDKVHKRELQLGSAAIASLIYLIDKYGF